MNPDLRPCDAVRPLVADHVDGLLTPEEDARVVAHLAGCTRCSAEADRARRMHAVLAQPWDVPAPSADLPLRALASARQRPGFHRAASVALRYGATFAAGIVVALLVLRAEPTPPAPVHVEVAAPAPQPAPEPASPSFSPRRIR